MEGREGGGKGADVEKGSNTHINKNTTNGSNAFQTDYVYKQKV